MAEAGESYHRATRHTRADYLLCYAEDYREQMNEKLRQGASIRDIHDALMYFRKIIDVGPSVWTDSVKFGWLWSEIMGGAFPPQPFDTLKAYFKIHRKAGLYETYRTAEDVIMFRATPKFTELLQAHLDEIERDVPLLALERLAVLG